MNRSLTILPLPATIRTLIEQCPDQALRTLMRVVYEKYNNIYEREGNDKRYIKSAACATQEITAHDYKPFYRPLQDGAFVSDTVYFFTHFPEQAARYYTSLAEQPNNCMALLMMCLWPCTYVLYIPPDVAMLEPLAVQRLVPENLHAFVHLMIIAEKNSQLMCIETHFSDKQEYAVVCYTVYQAEQARVTWLSEYSLSMTPVYASYLFVLHADAYLEGVAALQRSENLSWWLDIVVRERGAEALWGGYYVVQKKAEIFCTVRQKHATVSTSTHVTLHGILADQARSCYSGVISIDEKAEQSTAAQANKNILLSSQARAISEPTLEVSTYKVQCRHGSATGILAPEALTYLESRGLEHAQAKNLLLEGFVQASIPDSVKSLHERVCLSFRPMLKKLTVV